MDGKWLFLPDEAVPFMVAAVRAAGPADPAARPADDGLPAAAGDAEILGGKLLRMAFGTADGDEGHAETLAELARDPASPQAREQLTDRAAVVLRSAPAVAAEAAAAIAAFHRRRADAGDVRALVNLGDFLYWDEPQAARAAYQEAVDAGHLQALIALAQLLGNVLGDEEAARAAYDRAAADGDPELRAEAMYELACDHVLRRDATAAAMFRQVIDTRHPKWAAAAMVGLAKVLMRGDDPEGAAALCRQAAEAGDADWSAHASSLLGDVLEGQGDVAGAAAAWWRVIGSRSPEWAAPAFISLVNALDGQGDVDGLRAAYATGAQHGNPGAPYALLQLGQLLEARGDVDGAHAAWRQAIEAGCDQPGYWRERMSPSPRKHQAPSYPPGLPTEFDPRNMVRAGLDVLEHGLLPLPDVLAHEMAIPVAYWKAGPCAVVLILRFSYLTGEPTPMAMPVTYSRAADGTWEAPTGAFSAGSFSHDPIADPGGQRDLGGRPMTGGRGSWATEITPGSPASIVTGRAAPEVRYLAVVKDGQEDRRPLESHFGAWVVCNEQPGPFDVVGFSEGGDVLSRIPHSFPRRPGASGGEPR
jgi:tetratricopeptide (TPR) repeat protein